MIYDGLIVGAGPIKGTLFKLGGGKVSVVDKLEKSGETSRGIGVTPPISPGTMPTAFLSHRFKRKEYWSPESNRFKNLICIHTIRTLNPPWVIDQNSILELITHRMDMTPEEIEFLKKIYDGTAISRRHSV